MERRKSLTRRNPPIFPSKSEKTFNIKFESSSESSSVNDDIPMLSGPQQRNNQPILISDESTDDDHEAALQTKQSSEYSSYSDSSYSEENNQNWTSQKAQNNVRKDVQRPQRVRKATFDPRRTKIQPASSAEVPQIKNIAEKQENDHDDPQIRHHHSRNTAPPPNNGQQDEQAPKMHPIPSSNRNSIEKEPEPEQPPLPTHVLPPPKCVDTSIRFLKISREDKLFSKMRKNNFTMIENEKAIYFSSESKDNIGGFHIVTSSLPCQLGLSNFVGLIRFNSKGTKCLVISDEVKPHDDREGELCGISIHSAGVKSKREVSIALPINGKSYFSISKRLSLTSMASGETDIAADRFIRYSQSEGSNHSELSELGDVFSVPSHKNIVINDENGQLLFASYKISNGTYGIRCRYPITPYIAFGIGIAIMSF